MPKIVDVDAMKLQICEAAIDGLLDKEIPFSLRNLAHSIDKTKGFLQHYYSSIESIKYETFILLLKRQRQRLEQSRQEGNPALQLMSGLQSYLPSNEQEAKELEALTILAAYYPEQYREDRDARLLKGAKMIRKHKTCDYFVDGAHSPGRCLNADRKSVV